MNIENIQKACESFNQSIATLFPAFMCKAVLTNNLGPSITVTFANVASVQDAPHGILMNASGYMRFMMHLTDNRGNTLPEGSPVSIELLTWNIPHKSDKLKFRKINGKSVDEALSKLLAWFGKNAEAIKSL